MMPKKGSRDGFTILEVIITLIVASILGVIFLEFMGTSVQKSYVPVENARETMALHQILETMNADYRRLIKESPDPLEAFRLKVESLAYAGGDYSFETAYVTFTNAIDADTVGDEDELSGGGKQVLKVRISRGSRSITTLFTR